MAVRAFRSLGASLLLVLCVDCALLRRVSFEPPTASLRHVSVTGLGLKGGSLELGLDVYNPNEYELRSTRLVVAIDLEQTHFGEATLEQALRLPATAHTPVAIPLSFTWAGVGAGARALLSKGSVQYGLTGSIPVDAPGVGTRTVTLRRSGTVSVRDLVR